MQRNMKLRGTALLATVALLGGAAVVASGSTGAYFSDTHTGTVSGSVGQVSLSTSGGTGGDQLDLTYTNLLPGAAQTVTGSYGDSGNVPEDIYLTFPNATALSALNDLGQYGQLHISSAGSGAVGDVFDSSNLEDHPSCGGFVQGSTTIVVNGQTITQPGCWPLPNQLKIAGNVQPGQTGTFSLTFNYASKLGGSTSQGGGVFNTYPTTDGQTTINASDGTGSGLPYDVVATQVGITPGAPGTKP
jgi:hypothetical protein